MKFYRILFLIFQFVLSATAIELVAYFSQSGLHGEIHFSNSEAKPKLVQVKAFLETTLQYPDQSWSWSVHQNPIDYRIVDPNERCSPQNVGEQILSLDDKLGFLILPGNESSVWDDVELSLTGPSSLWGHSIVMTSAGTNFRICSSILTKMSMEQNDIVHIAEAKFRKGIAGSMYFQWLKSSAFNSDLLIYSTLYHIQDSNRFFNGATSSSHSWKIYATDIFDQTTDRIEENCNVLQVIYDPQNFGPGNSIGDIDQRVGRLNVSENVQKVKIHQMFQDDKLHLLPADLNGPSRKLYVVIMDNKNDFLACAKIRHLETKVAKALISSKGVKGEVTVMQRSIFEPTYLNFTFASADGSLRSNFEFAKNIAGFKVHHLPPSPLYAESSEFCETAEEVFNPLNMEGKVPPPGYGTQDQYFIGDLSGKLTGRNKMEHHNYIIQDGTNELNGIYWDLFLPLSGRHSIINRGFSIAQFNRENPENITETAIGCSSFALYEQNQRYQVPIQTAQVLFRYPIVGKILFRQPKDQPWHDTTVIIEYLIHADGSSVNNTENHRWSIHMHQPDKDFYSWQNRCVSTGDIINPHKVSYDIKAPEKTCSHDSDELCRLGDLTRLGTLSISGSIKEARKFSRKIFTDTNLPLSGFSSIMGKSVTIFDEHGPVARGERLACSIIGGFHRRKIVAKDWFANGGELSVKGKIEMLQQSEYETTNVEVNLKGLKDNSGYHVHITPVEGDLEFPCEATTLYGHWNPRNVNPKTSPANKKGSSDQYEMGDLSGKFGNLESLSEYDDSYNDTNLPLFGYESVVGRSIVIHKRGEKMARWACSTLERGYSPSEARELRAIASFHNPNGFAYGYMKFTQLIGNDNSQSDTVIEIKLRHPGENNRNITRNHHWQIYVNPIGIDATVATTLTRCVAGGYTWNPFYTQLADPLNDELYRQECGPKNPLRCYVGDVSARLGTIDIGLDRSVKSDPNFPLEGDVSALGRSIVIFGANHSSERYACANIEPDHDIVKYVNIERPPRFVLAQFIEDVRKVMGLPEWFLHIDSRTTQILHNGACIAFKLHFKGPKAHQLEQDFSRLISSGRLDEATLYIPGYVNPKRKKTIAYRACSVRDPNDKKKGGRKTFTYKTDRSSSMGHSSVNIYLLFISIIVVKFYL